MRSLDEHEHMHIMLEHGVSEGLRMAECQRDRARPVDRLDENVSDLPAVARRRGWDERELTHMVFEFGEEEGMRKMAELAEDDASPVVFQGGVVQEPRVSLALDELIPVTEVRQACEAPEPAKSVQILFRGEHGLRVWQLAAEQSLAERYSGWKLVGELGGYFATVGGRILDSKEGLALLGLRHKAEVVLHRRLSGGSSGGVVKGGCLPGTGSGRALIAARLIVGVRGTGVEFLGTLIAVVWGKVTLVLVQA